MSRQSERPIELCGQLARASIRDDISTVRAAVPAVQVQRPGSEKCIRTFIATAAPM